MKLRCVKCGWTAEEPEVDAVETGSCPECGGQLWVGEPTPSAILPEAVSMVFEAGSRIARHGSPHYRQHDLRTGAEQSGDSQAFPAHLLASPPVVQADGLSTGVFDLPALPDLNFDSAKPEPAVAPQEAYEPTEREEATDEEVPADWDDASEAPEASESLLSESEGPDEVLPELPVLPVMGTRDPKGQARGVAAGLSNAPLFIDTRSPSVTPIIGAVVVALAMVVGAAVFDAELAELGVSEPEKLQLSSEQLALDAYANALADYERGRVELAHDKLKEALTLNPAFAPAHTLLGSILAKKGQPSLALKAYLKGRALAGENKDDKVEEILGRAREFAELRVVGAKAEAALDWEQVESALKSPQGSVVPESPSSAKP